MIHTKEDYKTALDAIRSVCIYQQSYTISFDVVNGHSFQSIVISALQLAINLQPKPIEEAPKDNSRVYVYGLSFDKKEPRQCVAMYSTREQRWKYRGHGRALPFLPTHFYDLLALPKPKAGN